jgi:hypothetical protein
MNTFWSVSLVLVALAFTTRFVVAAMCGISSWRYALFCFVACLILLGLSFLVEGIILAVSKIEDYDEEATVATFKKQFGDADALGPGLVSLKHKSDRVLVGQPLIAIALAFLFNGVLNAMAVRTQTACPMVPTRLRFLLVLYSDGFVSVGVSTMLIYWVSQVLPQALGKRSAVAFMRFPGAMLLADLLSLIARTGVGEPGRLLENLVEKAGVDLSSPKLPLGNSKFLEAMSVDYERAVESRTIRIEPKSDGIWITDEARHVYLTKRQSIDHIFIVSRQQFDRDDGVTIKLGLPPGFVREVISANWLFRYGITKDILGAGDAVLDEDEAELLWSDSIYAIHSSSDRPIPWTTFAASYKYKEKQFNMSPERSTNLYFHLGFPTERIEIAVRPPPGCFIFGADLRFRSDESKTLDKYDPISRGNPSQERKDDGTIIIRHMYPPLAAEMILEVAVRVIDQLPG